MNQKPDVTTQAIEAVCETLNEQGNNAEWQQYVIEAVLEIVKYKRAQQKRALDAAIAGAKQ